MKESRSGRVWFVFGATEEAENVKEEEVEYEVVSEGEEEGRAGFVLGSDGRG